MISSISLLTYNLVKQLMGFLQPFIGWTALPLQEPSHFTEELYSIILGVLGHLGEFWHCLAVLCGAIEGLVLLQGWHFHVIGKRNYGEEELVCFLSHLNSVHPRMQFMVKKVTDDKLAFLDELIFKRSNGTFITLYTPSWHMPTHIFTGIPQSPKAEVYSGKDVCWPWSVYLWAPISCWSAGVSWTMPCRLIVMLLHMWSREQLAIWMRKVVSRLGLLALCQWCDRPHQQAAGETIFKLTRRSSSTWDKWKCQVPVPLMWSVQDAPLIWEGLHQHYKV